MIVHYTPELDRQSFYESAKVVRSLGVDVDGSFNDEDEIILGEIEDPEVALDVHKLGRMQNGKLIYDLFTSPGFPLISQYIDTENTWFKREGTWPASIDTLVHLVGQDKASDTLSRAETVWEVGCGTGFAGYHALERHQNIRTTMFSDFEPNGLHAVIYNHSESSKNRIVPVKTNGLEIDSGYKADAIIACAIPATPVYEGLERPINPLFEGTDFLETIIRDAPERLNEGGKLIISHTNLGEQEFNSAAKKYGAKVDRVLYQRPVAFRTEFLGDQKWVDYLVAEKGMEQREEGDWKYWHTPVVKEVSYS
ncbi:MAG: hypothetical protein KC506_03900 [Nanoarchaeota archaeon]|nr:hypothetical protein [Nanoarchaeota archaeon]